MRPPRPKPGRRGGLLTALSCPTSPIRSSWSGRAGCGRPCSSPRLGVLGPGSIDRPRLVLAFGQRPADLASSAVAGSGGAPLGIGEHAAAAQAPAAGDRGHHQVQGAQPLLDVAKLGLHATAAADALGDASRVLDVAQAANQVGDGVEAQLLCALAGGTTGVRRKPAMGVGAQALPVLGSGFAAKAAQRGLGSRPGILLPRMLASRNLAEPQPEPHALTATFRSDPPRDPASGDGPTPVGDRRHSPADRGSSPTAREPASAPA
jgi:hypothetical protein